ncbi:hypothetical protein BN130_4111 [Cronobacter malonaticus 507]|nr:hypothetical protein BN130_4111 [Cronobacter malonaticus 507]
MIDELNTAVVLPTYSSGISQRNRATAEAFLVPESKETRAHNIAFNYIVRAT